MNIEAIRPSADLRNHYQEISKLCHESRNSVVITVNGREDTAIVSFQEWKKINGELELLRILAEAEEDVLQGRLAPIQDSFDNIRKNLMAREKE